MAGSNPTSAIAPIAEKKDHKTCHHGLTRNDPYHWLRAENWQEVMRDPDLLDEQIRTYLEAENAYTEDRLSCTKELQEQIFEEMKGRIKEDDSSVPARDGPWAYYTSYVTGGQHPLRLLLGLFL